MARDGAIIFRDIAGKLDVLRVTCDKCGRSGQYPVVRLIERFGIDAKLFDFEPEADCPRKIARNDYDPCGARCPDPVEGGLGFGIGYRTIISKAKTRKPFSLIETLGPAV